jgi:predicted metal-dependent phosphoesterase TrpH
VDRIIDLHTHTSHSDGSTEPFDLVREALEMGLAALAITDHDTLSGWDCARTSAANRLELICGVELSTRPMDRVEPGARARSVHVLGYWLDSTPPKEFREFLNAQQGSRRQRNLRLVEKLQDLGMDVTLEDAERYGRNQVGRPHFARVLCDKGYVSNLREAFDIYLGDEGKAAVERDEPSIEEGVQRIARAGGLASLAHPVRLPVKNRELEQFVKSLAEVGLRGIEVFHSEHRPADCAELSRLANRLGLIATGGSDFHGAHKPGVRLGYGTDGNACLTQEFLERMKHDFATRS